MRSFHRPVAAPVPAALVALSVLVVLLACGARPSHAQPEKILDAPTGWSYLYGTTSVDLAAAINAGQRPFTMQRIGVGQYDAVCVANTGPYAVAGFGTANMHHNRTVSQMSTALTGRRLVSLDVLGTGSAAQINAISIPGDGAYWGWLVDQTRQQVVDWVNGSAVPLRVIDLDITEVSGQKRYAAVAVANQGAQYQGWWWYFDQNAAQIATLLEQNDARLVDIELETAPTIFSPARFSAVMVAQNEGAGWFYGSLSSDQLAAILAQTGSRITAMHRYNDALGNARFAVALVDNANDQTRRMRDFMAAEAGDAHYGFALRRVGVGLEAALNENFLYEPASSMKIVHAAFAVRACSLGIDNLDADNFVPNRCNDYYNTNVCPDDSYNCDPGDEPLSTTIAGMMRSSHNGRTHTIEEMYGRTTLNDFLELAQLPEIHINHTLGCLCDEPFNTATAGTMTRFYEQIADGTHFDATWRERLHDLMANLDESGYVGSFAMLDDIITQEAIFTDLTAAEVDDFREAMRMSFKPGGYACYGLFWRASAGLATVPFKTWFFGYWVDTPRDYAVATFVHDGTDPGAQVAYPALFELLREPIRAALRTWDDACGATIASQPQDVTVNAGQDALFTVQSGGEGAPAYQWQRFIGAGWHALGDASGQYAGTTTATLTVLAALSDDAGDYRCQVTKPCGTVTTAPATLTVQAVAGATPDALPARLALHLPHPNPFNPQVTLRFAIPQGTGRAQLTVYDVAGRRVRTLVQDALPAGEHAVVWNGADDQGRRLPSGAYIARLEAGGVVESRRVMMVE
jgi:hypothetical protein